MLSARPFINTLVLVTIAGPLGPAPVSARGAAFQPAGVVTGTVYDSLAGAPLADADVQLVREVGTTQGISTRTDSAGRFRFTEVEDGSYILGFLHARLDSLGIDPPAARVVLSSGGVADVDLAVPSRRSIVARFCPDDGGDAPTLLVGRVLDAAGQTGRRDAEVSVQWMELVVQEGKLVRAQRGGVLEVAADGRFAACNIPGDVEVVMRAAAGADTSGVLALQFPPSGVIARDIYLGASLTAATSADSTDSTRSPDPRSARLRGRVVNLDGTPIADARIEVWGREGIVASREDGAFDIPEVTGGSTTLEVRAVGYELYRRGIDLRTGAARDNQMVIELTRAPSALPAVTVVGRSSSALDRSGFLERKKGGVGRFIDEEELATLSLRTATSVIGRFPGTLLKSGGRGMRLFLRDAHGRVCPPQVFIDGNRLTPSAEDRDLDNVVDIDAWVEPGRIAGIELYTRVAQAPLQYGGTTPDGCGVIVIWRKERGRSSPPERR